MRDEGDTIARRAGRSSEAGRGPFRLTRAAAYAAGAGCGLAALAARLALEPIWGLRLPFILFYPATVVAAWLGGLGPGLGATAIGAAAAAYFWLAPAGSWRIDEGADLLGLAVFVCVGILVSVLEESRRRALTRNLVIEESLRAARSVAEEANQRLSLALAAGRMGTWEYRLEDQRVLWSDGLQALHGYEPGTFPGTFEAFASQIHPDDRERVLAAVREAAGGHHDHDVEYRVVLPEGSTRWVVGRGRLIFDAAGRPERLIGICADVTDSRLQQDRFELAIEASPAAMLIFDSPGSVVYANSSAHRLLGYPPGNLVGVEVERLVPATARGLHADHRRTFLKAPQPRPMGAGRALFAVRSDGVEVPVEIGLSPFEDGGETFVLAAVSDISVHRAAEAARAALLVAERESSRRKDEFLAALSHELRNPLAPLRNAAYILATAEDDLAATRAARQIIDRQTAQLVRLVDDLLDLSRIGQDRFELRMELVDLSSIVAAAIEASRPAIEDRQLTLSVLELPEPIWLRADPVRMTQVLTNILNNAAKYTPASGKIRLTTERRDSSALIVVRDTGVGMSPATVQRLFEMFYRDVGARTLADGLGIGLAIARHFVELHGGRIFARSDGPGQGSEFVVSLPLEAAPASSPSGGSEPPELGR